MTLSSPIKEMRKIKAIFLDCGDTLVDEGTEIKNSYGATLEAELIPTATELVHQIKRLGYLLALVADGPMATFDNVLHQHDLYSYFDAFAISAQVGAEKPDARMFLAALNQLKIDQLDYASVLMLGNNLERDIKGANQLGVTSVWLDWSPRRSKIPANKLEVPQYTIKRPIDLIDIIRSIEEKHLSTT